MRQYGRVTRRRVLCVQLSHRTAFCPGTSGCIFAQISAAVSSSEKPLTTRHWVFHFEQMIGQRCLLSTKSRRACGRSVKKMKGHFRMLYFGKLLACLGEKQLIFSFVNFSRPFHTWCLIFGGVPDGFSPYLQLKCLWLLLLLLQIHQDLRQRHRWSLVQVPGCEVGFGGAS